MYIGMADSCAELRYEKLVASSGSDDNVEIYARWYRRLAACGRGGRTGLSALSVCVAVGGG